MKAREFYPQVPTLFTKANRVAWEAYEETLFTMRRPVTYGNYHRICRFVGAASPPSTALRDARVHTELDRVLAKARYPRAGQLSRLEEFSDGATELATAFLHFNNPAYPIYDTATVRGLNHLGHPVNFVPTINQDTVAAYQAYLNVIQELKDEIPYFYVPEKNYYLTRIVQESLWQLGIESPMPKVAPAKAPSRRSTH